MPAVISGGSDGLSCAVIKTFEDELLEPLKITFNRSI